MKNNHIPVLLNEVLDNLALKKNGIYIDLTLGMGGHSKEILKRIPKGKLIAFDKDDFAIKNASKTLSEVANNFEIIKSDFKDFKEELSNLGIYKVDGILADLGISSPQIDNAERGFSYLKNSALDMRMDQSQKLSAYDVVNLYPVEKLEYILKTYGEVKNYKYIASKIIEARPINTTLELANLIKSVTPQKLLKLKNPAKNVFQAIRIEVNNELDSIHQMLSSVEDLLKVNASLLIISFHSLEDKIVKNYFQELTKPKLPSKMPIQEDKFFATRRIYPSKQELNLNSRSKSAKLRILTKIKD